ncbi:MAG TPA: mandelate racemase/muconate lactonizing enzyme family protein [Thermomicrobiales bacterium]|nr:mandelate racemase/muconate lactonizing enzyme family protein [Thermomicrobiales bacterium]
MKITDIQTFQLAGPDLEAPLEPAWAPGTVWRRWGGTVVKVFTDEGIVGLGSPGYGASPIIESWLKPQLVGQDPFSLERHARLFRQANAAWGVEIALWDIIGKACGQPLYKLWGGYRDRVPAYASFIEVRTPERRAADVAARRAEGWRAVKLRLHDWTLTEDIEQVEAVRRAVGDEVTILADANQAQQPGTPHPGPTPVWTYERALATARELERLGAYWLEEPLDRYDFEGLTRLCAAADILIAGGENNRGLHEYRWLVERDCYDVLQPEAMVGETMSQLRKAAALAELHHKLCAPHHGGGGLGFVAHLHLCAAIPNCPYVEVFHDLPGISSDAFQWYLAEPLRLDPADGCIPVPQGPGLGVEIDEEKLRRYVAE